MKPFLKLLKYDGRIIARYTSVLQAARDNNFYTLPQTIRSSIYNRALCRGAYFYRFEDEYTGFEDFSKNHNRPVFAKEIESNQVLWFESLSAAANALFISADVISTTIKQHGGKMPILGYEFAYQKSTNDAKKLKKLGYEVKICIKENS